MESESLDCSREVYKEWASLPEQMPPLEVSSQVSVGELILKNYKCFKGSHAWEQLPYGRKI